MSVSRSPSLRSLVHHLCVGGREAVDAPWCLPGHRQLRLWFDRRREYCEARWPRTWRLAIGLSAAERRSVSIQRTRPETIGCFPTAVTARRLTWIISPKPSVVWTGRRIPTRCAWWHHRGAVVVEFDAAHSADGLVGLCRRLAEASVRRVAIERPDGPVVEALLDAGLEVVVVSSRAVKALRARYGTAGNKCDRGDARRDRRLPGPVPRPRVPRSRRRRHTLHPILGPAPQRRLPLGLRQETPRSPLRLRRRQPTRQRLGPTPLPDTASQRQTPPPRRTPSSPAAGPTSSGAAGKTTPPTTPPNTAPTNTSNPTQLDIGLLTGRSGHGLAQRLAEFS